MRSQQVMRQSRELELPTTSKQQPGSLPMIRPAGIEAATAAVVLTALGFCLVLAYAVASASIARGGYTEMQLRQQLEELHAETALLRYQIHLTESGARVRDVADSLGLTRADPVKQVDYVGIPPSFPSRRTQLAAVEPHRERAGLASALAELATEIGAGGRAEASTLPGHRR